ncbi:MAG: hydroxymethylglutaryl-CoA lyase [Elusimicrobia bacterium]|nr:hydroxymethylglutaryl-CoA lyase [Elusimicrobiota bacterium]
MTAVKKIHLQEVGLRDGIQHEEKLVPAGTKIRWAERMLAAGLDLVQLGSFVRADKVPQMADTGELFKHFLGRDPKLASRLSALALNEKGLERGMKCGVQVFCVGSSASETHSRENTGMGTEEAALRVAAMAREALNAGKTVHASVHSSFGCGYEGPVPAEKVLSVVKTYLEAGVGSIGLSDTAGHANPPQVKELFSAVARLAPGLPLSCHFHNAYGTGMANCFAALETGVTWFDTSAGGLGGCPFIKLPSGNVCTEDFVHTLQRMGLRKDVDLEELISVARAASAFFGRELPGAVMKTGPIPGFGK